MRGDDAVVVGAVQRPLTGSAEHVVAARPRRTVAAADAEGEAKLTRETKYLLHSTLQVWATGWTTAYQPAVFKVGATVIGLHIAGAGARSRSCTNQDHAASSFCSSQTLLEADLTVRESCNDKAVQRNPGCSGS